MINDQENIPIKYSLKNKEFNKKKHNIFDNHNRKSRSKTLSPSKNLNFSPSKNNINITKQYAIKINTLNLEHSVVQKLNQFSSKKNSFHIQSNQEEKSLFQSFAKAQHADSNHQAITTTNHTIKPSRPLKIQLQSKQILNNQNTNKTHIEISENKSESFQVCEGSIQNPSRVNRFFTQSILNKESQSPHNKVVFQPVIRKSLSPSPKSLSPDNTSPKITMNKFNSINLKIQPETQVQQIVDNHPVERRVCIMQIPRQNINSQNFLNNQNKNLLPSSKIYPHQTQRISSQDNEIIKLKKKIEEQDLQIQFLKNKKEIIESNMQLQFSPQKGYQTSRFQQPTYFIVTPEKYGQPVQIQNKISQINKNKLLQLAQILSNNHLKLTLMEQKYQKVYSIILNQFDKSVSKCQQLLIQLFSQKFYLFTEQLNAKLSLIDKKSAEIQVFQNKIDIFSNTFRNIEENLRITKLKQQNIELLIENKYKRTDNFWSKQQGSRFLLMQNKSDISSIRKYEDNQMEEKDREDLFRLQKNIGNKNVIPQWDQNSQDFKEFDSFLDDKYSHLVYKRKNQHSVSRSKSKGSSNSRKKRQRHFKNHQHRVKSPSKIFYYVQNQHKIQNRSTSQEIQQFSPFQANQMFKNQIIKSHHHANNFMKYSEILPQKNVNKEQNNMKFKYPSNNQNPHNLSFNDNQSSKNYDFSENSFEIQMDFKPAQKSQVQKQISFNSNNMFKKPSSKTNTQNQEISDTLQGQQERIFAILKGKNYQFPVDCWLDEMGCLRKKNQTYIFDEQGSVIITTAAAFKKLKQKRIFV